MNDYAYTVELQDAPNDWNVYKLDADRNSVVGYKVELHAHGKEAHRCSCEFGVRQPNGQKIKRCKHVEMVLDEEFRRNKQKAHI